MRWGDGSGGEGQMVAEGGWGSRMGCAWWGDGSGGEGLMGAKVGYRVLRGWVWGWGSDGSGRGLR